jgi:SAM-dependent methyltransferase
MYSGRVSTDAGRYGVSVDSRELRAGFDEAALDYERTRPVCPPELFDDLVELTGLGPGDRVVEIGCGTGQATVPLAARGLAVTAVELGTQLAALARNRLAGFATAHVVTSSFEDWEPDEIPYAAVVAVNSLHWIDPPVRFAKPFQILGPGGTMVVAGCHWARPVDAEPFWAEVQADYQAVEYEGSPPPPPEAIGPAHLPAEAEGFFAEVASRRYPFEVRYTAEAYLAVLATQSTTRALGEARRADFLARVRRRLERHGWPELTATFVGYLVVGRRYSISFSTMDGSGG